MKNPQMATLNELMNFYRFNQTHEPCSIEYSLYYQGNDSGWPDDLRDSYISNLQYGDALLKHIDFFDTDNGISRIIIRLEKEWRSIRIDLIFDGIKNVNLIGSWSKKDPRSTGETVIVMCIAKTEVGFSMRCLLASRTQISIDCELIAVHETVM